MSAIVTKHGPRLKAHPANLNHVKRLRKVNKFLFCVSSHSKYMYVPCMYKGMLGEFINPLFFFGGGGEGWVGVGKGLQKESAKNKV